MGNHRDGKVVLVKPSNNRFGNIFDTKRILSYPVFLVQFSTGYSDDYHLATKMWLVAVLTGEHGATVSGSKVRRFGP